MGILDNLKKALTPLSTLEKEFEKILKDSRASYKSTHEHFYWDQKVNELSICTKEVVLWSDNKKVDFIIYCMQLLYDFNKKHKSYSYIQHDDEYKEIGLVESYINYLFKAKLLMEDTDVERLQIAFNKYKKHPHADILNWPVAYMLNQLEKQYKGKILSETMVNVLNRITEDLGKITNSYYEKDKLKLIEKIKSILFKQESSESSFKPTYFLGDDDFSEFVNQSITTLKNDEKVIWFQLIAKAQKATGSKPSQKFLNETKVLLKELSSDKFKKMINEWFHFIIKFKEKEIVTTHSYGNQSWEHRNIEFLSPINIEAIKGFVWICSHFHDSNTIHTISNLAERCFKKIPEKGPASAAIGNACLYTLYKSKGLDGIGQLSRLKLKIKQNNTQTLIENYLNNAAKEQGVSLHEIEDLAVEDFGLIDGVKEVMFDDFKAIIRITGAGKSELAWIKPDGNPQKTVPESIKSKYALKYKKLKDTQKKIDQTTSAQRDRLDRMLRYGRTWVMENFIKHYSNHGLMFFLADKIIWIFRFQGKEDSAIWLNYNWMNNKMEVISPNENSTISLWHPATQAVEEIKNWREFLMLNKIQQPIKQAFREVYLLTEAEIRTRTYSNRMAAHILKQHQYVTLAKGRNWTCRLIGSWDGGDQDIAELKIPEYKLKAQFWVQSVEADNAYNDNGIWNYVSTDQVRFLNVETNDLIDLVDIPAIPFSEVLRDVDLFVGVASVGNDPTWSDSGGIPAFRDYWTSFSFGDLTEVAKNRKEILTGLLPRLKISKVAEIKDKFLVVKGKLRTYKIHIGSTNILMEPNDQYLCIVPDRSAKSHTENLFIPFEGDNGLSIVLSKAFLLSEDDKITDSSITSQINRK